MDALQKEKLLIVDTLEERRTRIGNAFRGEFDIVAAMDGEAAMEVLEQHHSFAAVLLRCRLEAASGFDVLLRLNTLHLLDTVPVIAIGEPEDEMKALSMGATDFVREPADLPLLRYRLNNLLFLLHNERDYDALTGLYKRRKFMKEAARLLQSNPGEHYSLIYTNIERFRVLNDLYGQNMGDRLLCGMGSKLAERWPSGVVGRISGDHFAVCCPSSQVRPEELQKISSLLTRQFNLCCSLRLLYGIYEIENSEMPVQQMCDRAQMALGTLSGKSAGQYAYYDEKLRRELLAEQEITDEMEGALAGGQFQVYLQPIYSLSTGAPVSAEALVRWIHPQKGVIPPGKFIPLFERNGFISRLDTYVWETAVRDLAELKRLGFAEFPITANMSRMDFYDTSLCDKLIEMTKKYGVDPSMFRIEITESAYMDNSAQLLDAIKKFNAAGFSVLMDDFGSGYSSLSMLMDIPVSTLKIDMGFVRDVGLSERSNSLINSIIRMAKWLEMTVVAEGVETRGQLDYLRSIGCDRVQGYYYSKPLPFEHFKGLISNFEHGRIAEEEHTFDKIDACGVWKTITNYDHTIANILAALAMYESFGDILEVVSVNDEYYRIMETTPDDLFRNTKNAIDWVCEEDRVAFLGAVECARMTERRQDLVIGRYIGSCVRKLFFSIAYLGQKDNHYLFIASIRDLTPETVRTLKEHLPADGEAAMPAFCPLRSGEARRNKILIADDNQVNRMMLKKMLADEYEVLEAANGKEALLTLRCNPDTSAILLDLIMPIMDGYAFLQDRAREEPLRTIPVLVLSQSEARGSERRTLELGANDFIRKPYEPSKLRKHLSDLIRASEEK